MRPLAPVIYLLSPFFTFMAIQGLAPSYMSELVHIQQSQQFARSATVRRLVQPRSATQIFFHHRPSHM